MKKSEHDNIIEKSYTAFKHLETDMQEILEHSSSIKIDDDEINLHLDTDLIIKNSPIKQKRLNDDYRPSYNPRVDIGIGPFHASYALKLIKDNGRPYLDDIYTSLHKLEKLNEFIKNIRRSSLNYSEYRVSPNYNRFAHCFCVVEVEFSKDIKHIIGSMFVASSLGRLGILVYENKNYPQIKSIFESFLSSNEQSGNLIVDKNNSTTSIANSIFSNLIFIDSGYYMHHLKNLEDSFPKVIS